MTGRHVMGWVTGLVLAGIFVGGCGDIITFSKISRDKGKIYVENGQYEEADGAFRDAIRQNPRDYESHYYLGSLFARRQQYANAVAELRTSLEVQPLSEAGKEDSAGRIRTIQALADSTAKLQDRDAAVNTLETKAASDTTGETYYMLGRVYAARGDADSAIVAYGKAADQSPKSFYIIKEQGLYLEKMGQKPEAEQVLRRAYRMSSQDTEINAGLRRLGVVPGPSLKDPSELSKPPLPKGPLPDYLNRDRPSLPAGGPNAAPAD